MDGGRQVLLTLCTPFMEQGREFTFCHVRMVAWKERDTDLDAPRKELGG